MRILCVIPASIRDRHGGEEELAHRCRLLREYAADGTEIDLTDVPEGPAYLAFAYEEYLSVPPTMARIQEAKDQGYDAAILGCFRDPGLEAMREVSDILVVGAGEAAFHAAAMLGHSFSVLITTVNRGIIAATQAQVRQAGLASKLASVRVVELTALDQPFERDTLREKLILQSRQALDTDGADTLILGTLGLGFQGLAEDLAHVLAVPVINPSRWCVKITEALLSAGYVHSKRAFVSPPDGTGKRAE